MADHKRKILVTGANGFVGSAVVSELAEAGIYDVYGLVGKNAKIDRGNQNPKQIFRTNIAEYESFREAENLRNIETLIHTAGLAHQFGRVEPEDFRKVNVQGTENVCRLAQKIGIRHFILISSVAVYGNYGNSEIDETYVCRPAGIYAESKLESENAAREFCEKNNIRLTIVRPATVIGEGDRGNTSRLITQIDNGRFVWVGRGSNRKSLIYKKDVARGILKIVESLADSPHEIYNLSAEPVSMREVVGTIFGTLQKKSPRFHIPEGFVRGLFRVNRSGLAFVRLKNFEKTFEKWVSNDIFSGRKFNEKFGFRCDTAVSEALARQVRFYLMQKNKNSD